MITRQYQTYYGIHFNHHEEIWAGESYHKILVKEYPHEDLSTSDTTEGTTISFLIPQIYMYKYYLDGMSEGWFTLYNQDPSDDATLENFTASLIKTPDVPGADVVLGSKTMTPTIDNIIGHNSYLKVPIFIYLEKQVVEAGNKLILSLDIDTDGGDVVLSHANDSNTVDVKIRIPYAPTG